MAEDPSIHDLAAGLIESEPLMVIGRTVANAGQKVQDAWDTIQSHLSDLASQAKAGAQSAVTNISAAVMPTVQAQSPQQQPKSGITIAGLSTEGRPSATKQPDSFSDEELLQLYKEPKADLSLLTPDEQQRLDNLTNPAQNWRQAVGKGQVIFSNKVLAGARESLPAVGAVGGQILGAEGGPAGTITGAAAGGMVGERIRQYLRAATGAEPLPDQVEATRRMLSEGLKQGTYVTIGEALGNLSNLIPSRASAGAKFEQVMGAARNVPVNVEAAGQSALRIQQLAERGGRMPKPVNDFLKYATNPDKPPMTYEVARDFASSISKLSVNEYNALNPKLQREVAIMAANLNKSVAEAASKAGQGQVYSKAMTEYARAMRLKGMVDDFLSGARKSLPWMLGGSAAAAGAYGAKKVMDVVGGGE